VLVTGGDHTGPLAAIRALRTAGYEPWVSVTGPKAYAARSRAAAGTVVLPDSRTNPGAFIEGLTAAAEKHGVGVILGGTERDLIAIARGRERLGQPAAATPRLGEVLRVTDKKIVNEFAARVGVRIPSTIEVDDAGLDAGDDLATPLIVKSLRSELETPDGGFLQGEVQRVDTANELCHFAATAVGERWLVQSRLEGRLGAICGVAWEGKIVCAVHQLAERTWPANVGVSSYARTVTQDPELEAAVARLVAALGWSGIFQAQFIHADDGTYLIDFNPRIYGSLALAIAAGANLPAIWVALLTGSAFEPPAYRVGVRYLLRTGNVAAASLGLLPRRDTTHAVASLADPLPILTSLAKLRRFANFRDGKGATF
jgi:predicted ATP-grasp superfamily ATP-dependent carboligase